MLKTVLSVFLTLAIAIGLGAWSVWYALDRQGGIGALQVGAWTAYPDMGTDEADPYTEARVARAGTLVLGRAEGLAFVARRDAGGAPLERECAYSLDGSFPSARFWTLYAADKDLRALHNGGLRQPQLQSYQVVFRNEGTADIAVSDTPEPGNWLMLTGKGPFSLVLTLYDTPIATGTGLSDIHLPRIVRGGCHA